MLIDNWSGNIVFTNTFTIRCEGKSLGHPPSHFERAPTGPLYEPLLPSLT